MTAQFTSLKKRIQSVNARILGLERRYGKDSRIVKRIYHYLNLAQGTDNLTRYRLPKADTSLRDIAKFERGLAKAENSAYLTKEGRAAILQKAKDTFGANMREMGYDASDAELEQLLDSYVSIKDIVYEGGSGWSSQVIDAMYDAMRYGLSSKQLIQLAKDYQQMTTDANVSLNLEFYDYIRDMIDND